MSILWRQAMRGIVRRPALALLVVAIMALCIGGTAAIFSAAKVILFQGLPFRDADRLVILNLVNLPDRADNNLSWIESADWQRRTRTLRDLSPFLDWQTRVLYAGDSAETIGINFVTPDYFRLLGVGPALGRTFTAQENGAPGSAPVIVLSDGLWARRFGRDPKILGRTLLLNTTTYTAVGVMPAGFFDFMQRHHAIDAWMPAVEAGENNHAGRAMFYGRDERYWDVLARLAPGTTVEQAGRETDAIAAGLRREFPDTNRDYGARLIPLRSHVYPDLEQGMAVLLAGALLVLLIGCANVANLLLVRQAEHRRDLAVRLALGASPRRLARLALAESLLLALPGGAAGTLLAWGGARLLAAALPLPPFAHVGLDLEVLVFVLAVSLATGLLFGLPPALAAVRLDAGAAWPQLRGGDRAVSPRGRAALLMFQVAVVVMLLIVAGLLLRSFLRLRGTGVDFPTGRLLAMRLAFASPRYDDRSRITEAEQEIQRRLEGVAGVAGAAVWGPDVPGMGGQYLDLKPAEAAAADPSIRSDAHFVGAGALALLGVPLLHGREFTARDTMRSPRVVVISESLARALWPPAHPSTGTGAAGAETAGAVDTAYALGRRLGRADRPHDPPWTVVGVIRDTRIHGRMSEGIPIHHVMFPRTQEPRPVTYLVVRSTGPDPAGLAAALRRAVGQVDPRVPVFDVATVEERLRGQEAGRRIGAAVTGLFAGLALLLAVLGLYGVLAHAVAQRTREIGLRMALGAARLQVVALFVGRGLRLVLVGVAAGLMAALAAGRLVARLLYGVTPGDPATFCGVTVLVLAVAVLASYWPARRAAGVDPVAALRGE